MAKTESRKQNRIFREDRHGKTIKIYLSEEGKEELEEIRANDLEYVEENVRQDIAEFLDTCISVFEKRKAASKSADEYAKELGATTPAREIERCCPVYTKYTVDNYCRKFHNILTETKQEIDRQVLAQFR